MKKRVKLFTTIASLCLAVALMAFGVYAAANVTYNVNGTVQYVMTDVLVNVTTTLQKSKLNAKGVSKDLKATQFTDAVYLALLEADVNGTEDGTTHTFTTIGDNDVADDSKLDKDGNIAVSGANYDLKEASVYVLTITITTINDAGVVVTPSHTNVQNDAFFVVAKSVVTTTEGEGQSTETDLTSTIETTTTLSTVTVNKGTTTKIVFYIALADVTKQIPEGTALNFSFVMEQVK